MGSNSPIVLQASASNQGSVPPGEWSLGGYTFDAWLKLQHGLSITITKHPVEVGAAVADHAYANERRFVFEIGTSDCLTGSGYNIAPGGGYARIERAYERLTEMAYAREALTLVTKYDVYDNILIEDIQISDDSSTQTSMRAVVTLMELITAEVSVVQQQSSDPQATDQTNRGQQLPKDATRLEKAIDALKTGKSS